MRNDFYVYVWTNLTNKKKYVGKGVKGRAGCHLRWAEKGGVQCPAFYAAIRKYGRDSFSLQYLALGLDETLAVALEVAAIQAYDCRRWGYNLTDGGDGLSGYVSSPERTEKLRRANLGATRSDEARANMSRAALARSPEAKRRIRESVLASKTPEWKAKISAAQVGRVPSEACRLARSLAMRAKHAPRIAAAVTSFKGDNAWKHAKAHKMCAKTLTRALEAAGWVVRGIGKSAVWVPPGV
jgi:group I intron endonuclease